MPIKPGWEGRYFEDFSVGDVYRCRLGRTGTEADNIWQQNIPGTPNCTRCNSGLGTRLRFTFGLADAADPIARPTAVVSDR